MATSKVSIIVPVYKSENYLELLLDDLLMQTYKNIEIIIVNDGSPDNSQEIIEKYAIKDNRIKFVKTENQGVSMARNIGLKMATGKFIRFVDADDRVPLDSIQLLVEGMEQDEDIDIVFGVYKDASKRQLYTGKDNKSIKVSKKQMLQRFVMYTRTFYYGVVWNKLYKKDIIEKNDIRFQEDITWCEDFLFNLEYYDKCEWAYYLDNTKSVYTYVEHANSTMVALNQNRNKEVNKRLNYIDDLRKNKARELFAQYGLERQFDLQWEYTFLYCQLLALGRPKKQKRISDRYRELKQILNDKDVKEYVEQKIAANSREIIWKIVYSSIIREHYLFFFIYLLFRGIVSTYMCWLTPLWHIITNKRKPKSL